MSNKHLTDDYKKTTLNTRVNSLTIDGPLTIQSDEYSGTFVPNLESTTGSLTFAGGGYTTREGKFRKIGNLVYFWMLIIPNGAINGGAGVGGDLQIGNVATGAMHDNSFDSMVNAVVYCSTNTANGPGEYQFGRFIKNTSNIHLKKHQASTISQPAIQAENGSEYRVECWGCYTSV